MRTKIRNLALSSTALALVALAEPAFAQSTTVFNTLWEVKVGGADYMTTYLASERDAYPSLGQFAYIPQSNISGTAALNRLWNGVNDHMDSVFTSEASYTLGGVLGYGWTTSTAVPGLSDLNRLIASSGDHATVKAGDTISGYSGATPFSRWVFPRYKTANTSLNALTAGGVTISSNSVAGGALWSWVWNGTEFIDSSDYGRLLQSAMFWAVGGVYHNPTEAGGFYSTSIVGAANAQGSPVVQNSNSGSTQTTRSVPVEWYPDSWGGDVTHPVIYTDMIMGKDMTLNYNSMGPVAQYITTVTTSSSVSNADIEVPTGYMPATFNRYYTYDASSQTLTEVFPLSSCSGDQPMSYAPSSGYGGLIISNSAQTRAMAVYAKTTTASGPIGSFFFYQWTGCGGPSKWSAVTPLGTVSAGTHTYNSYITTGTLTNVVANMRQLYVDGAP
jgi:hypothetical protein